MECEIGLHEKKKKKKKKKKTAVTLSNGTIVDCNGTTNTNKEVTQVL